MESKRVGNEQFVYHTLFFFFNISFLFQEIGVRYHTEANLAVIMSVLRSLLKSSEHFICKLAGTTYGLSFPRVLGKCYF